MFTNFVRLWRNIMFRSWESVPTECMFEAWWGGQKKVGVETLLNVSVLVKKDSQHNQHNDIV